MLVSLKIWLCLVDFPCSNGCFDLKKIQKGVMQSGGKYSHLLFAHTYLLLNTITIYRYVIYFMYFVLIINILS